jgi:molecular chaperone IbpA
MDNPFGLQRYGTADLESLMDRISRNSIGLDTYFENIFNVTNQVNYPPYNIVHVNNVESRLEIALAGFKKKEIKVYTEYGKLVVEGTKETKEEEEYLHRGLASRSFKREWSLSDDIEVKDVTFADGLLTAKLGKIIPDHHARKDYLQGGAIMKLTTPFSVIKNAMSDIKRMHDFNYTLPKENYWDNECKEHPTNSHCLVYCD